MPNSKFNFVEFEQQVTSVSENLEKYEPWRMQIFLRLWPCLEHIGNYKKYKNPDEVNRAIHFALLMVIIAAQHPFSLNPQGTNSLASLACRLYNWGTMNENMQHVTGELRAKSGNR